jgi:hypothetical protein
MSDGVGCVLVVGMEVRGRCSTRKEVRGSLLMLKFLHMLARSFTSAKGLSVEICIRTHIQG